MGMFDNSEASGPVNLDFENEQAQPGAGADNQDQPTDQQLEGDNRQPDVQAGEANQQELILGKFKSQDELIKAYQNLEKHLRETRNFARQLQMQPQQTQMGDAQQENEQTEWTEEDWANYNAHFYQEFAQNPGKAVYDLVTDVVQQMIAPIYENIQNQQLSAYMETAVDGELGQLLMATDAQGQPMFPDAAELADEIDAFLDANPYFYDLLAQQYEARANGQMSPDDMGVLNVIYKAVKADAATRLGQQAFQNGLQQGVKSAQAKTMGQLTTAQAKSANTEATSEAQVINEIMSYRRGGFFG